MASISRAAMRLQQPAARWTSLIAPTRRLPITAVRGVAKDNRPSQGSRFAKTSSASQTSKPSRGASQTPQRPTPASSGPKVAKQATSPKPQPSTTPPISEQSPATEIPSPIESIAESIPEPEAPRYPLPDLTQGIPSTLEYETAGSRDPAALATLPLEAAGGGRGKGELPASAYISSSEKRRQKFANYAFASAGLTMVFGTAFLGRNWDDEEAARHPDVPNGWGVGLWWNRAMARTKEYMTYYHEPAFEKLLPDPDPMFARPYTLCISLEDMLVHSEWTREHGWRIAKRPGADYFIHYLSQYYEIVLFTTVPFAIGEPLVRKLDPFRFIVWPLFREATKFKDGEIVKDLSYLNRDLSKVIMIDTNASHVRAQPENAIVLPKWTGDPHDKDLVGLIPFLEYIHTMQYADVRKVLDSFQNTNIPAEFARREAIARAEFNKSLAADRKRHPHKGQSAMASIGSLLGLKPQNMSVMMLPEGEQNPAEAFAQGKMLQDIARERGRKGYEMMEKEIRENGEKWLKEEAAMQEKAQQEAMSNMKSSFTGWFVPGGGNGAQAEKKP